MKARESHIIPTSHTPLQERRRLEESRWSGSREDLLAAGLLVDTVGERELEALGEELLDVRAADVLGLLNFDDLEDLLCSQYGKVELRLDQRT
jgi:hypothetical protein